MYKFSKRSEGNLVNVHKDLVYVITGTLNITPIDFTVIEGVRDYERQVKLFDSGASKTMNSMHLLQDDGTGHAIDVAPYINGIRWDWPLFYSIAEAVREVSMSTGIEIKWGGIWDRKLSEISRGIEEEVNLYTSRRAMLGKKAFLDGPHFQLAE